MPRTKPFTSKPPKSGSIDERVATWPLEAQGDLMRFIIDTEVRYFGAYRLSDDERKAVQEEMDQARRGECEVLTGKRFPDAKRIALGKDKAD